MSILARRIVVSGTVQGVFFRESARRQAVSAEVSGWVRNRPDGTVELWAEGPPDAVATLESWCRRGPRGAQVEKVAAENVEPAGKTGFEIR